MMVNKQWLSPLTQAQQKNKAMQVEQLSMWNSASVTWGTKKQIEFKNEKNTPGQNISAQS